MIRVYEDYTAMSRAAAELFAERAKQAAGEHGMFTVALSGGTTPRLAYRMLAQEPLRDMVPWDTVHVFWGDERCVPFESSMSNAGMAHAVLLDHVLLPAANIHPVRCEQFPERSAATYGEELSTFFFGEPVFDLVFLGLGENGHTASLFPGSPVLHDTDRIVASVFVSDMFRVTLTARTINRARHIAFLVSGGSKAEILKEVLEGAFDPDRLPAQLIQPAQGTLYWIVDEQAASLLEQHTRTGSGGA